MANAFLNLQQSQILMFGTDAVRNDI